MSAVTRALGRTLVVVGVLAVRAFASWQSVGGVDGVWLIKPAGEGPEFAVLYVSGRPTSPRARSVSWLGGRPEGVAGDSRTLLLVGSAKSGMHPVRRITARTDAASGEKVLFSDAEALAPLPSPGAVHSLVLTRHGVVATVGAPTEAGDATEGVFVLDGARWRSVPLPPALAGLQGLRARAADAEPPDAPAPGLRSGVPLVSANRSLVVVEPHDGRSAWVLSLPDEAWAESPGVVRTPSGTVLGLGAVQVTVTREASGEAVLSLLAPAGPIEQFRTAPVPPEFGAAALGGVLLLAWESAGTGLECQVLTPFGIELYRGPLAVAGPVSESEAATLMLALASLFGSVVLFVVRPVASRAPVALPAGLRYAEPGRRLAATVIDFAPGIALAELSAPYIALITPDGPGPWPLLLALLVATVLGAAGEAMFGRSLGKVVMGCRTIRRSGERPGVTRAVARNAAKYLLAPLGIFSLLVPQERAAAPGAFGTAVVVEMPPSGAPN